VIAQAWDRVKAAGLDKTPDAGKRFAAAARVAVNDPRGHRSPEAWADALNKAFAGGAPATKPTARDLIAARMGKGPPPLPASAQHDATAAKFLAGRPHVNQITPRGKVHKITDGASLQRFYADGGTLPGEAAMEAAKAFQPAGPVAQQTLSTASQWAASQADKHADRVAAHFGITREKAHALLTNAITQIAAHAAKNGGKVGTLTIRHKGTGKTATLAPKKPTGGAAPRPVNPDGKGSGPPVAKSMSSLSDADGGALVAPAAPRNPKRKRRHVECLQRVLKSLEEVVVWKGFDRDEKRDDSGRWSEEGGAGNDTDEPEMTDQDAKQMFTQGGCGILAQEVLKLIPDAVPVLWRRKDGSISHAAVSLNGRLIHFGDRDEGGSEASSDELDEAVRYDFDPRMPEDECRAIAKRYAKRLVAEL
jgi:hypothetical protein